MLANPYRSPQNSCAIETGLLDLHRMTMTVMKTLFQKQKQKITNYHDYRYFSESEYRQQILYELSFFGNAWRVKTLRL